MLLCSKKLIIMLPVLTYYAQSKQPLTLSRDVPHGSPSPNSSKCMALESVATDSLEGKIETVDSTSTTDTTDSTDTATAVSLFFLLL